MNDTVFDQRITAAFAALPGADVYLKNRLLHLPEENKRQAARRGYTRKLLPLAGGLAMVLAICIAIPLLGRIKPPRPPIDLPLIPYGSVFDGEGGLGGGMGFVWSANAAELHRDSPAYGREGALGAMPVYRNPSFGKALQLDEAAAMEIAAKFSEAMGRDFVYVPDTTWEEIEARIKAEQPQKWQDMQDTLEANRQNEWKFQCGDETLNVTSHYGTRISLNSPLPAGLPKGDGTAARYEAMCQQVYDSYAAGVEALTGLRYNMASTALSGYIIYGEKDFETFFYVNNPGDPLAKQAEDYALNRVGVSVLEEKDYVDTGYDREGNAVETISHQDAAFYLGFVLPDLKEQDLLGSYPVMDLEAAKRELLAGRCEAVPEVTSEMLARAAIEDVELVYSNSPWLSAWMPMYRFSVLFAPEDMAEYPRAVEFGVRSYYDFYVPAVPPEYLVPRQEDGGVPRLGG